MLHVPEVLKLKCSSAQPEREGERERGREGGGGGGGGGGQTVLAARVERALAHDLLLEERLHGAQLVQVRRALHDRQERLRAPRRLLTLARAKQKHTVMHTYTYSFSHAYILYS